MLPELEICQRARQARDPRFDGRFFIGVLTTGIYCRPVCPARMPAEENVRYFPSSASAQDAGFRPCLRCRPETARRLPEWTLSSQTVIRGMRMIDAGFLDEHSVQELGASLSISTRHLNRLFLAEVHATPKSLARARRVQLAKRLIDQSNLALAEVAMRSGFGSVRRFNDEVRLTYGRSPRALRKSCAHSRSDDLELFLPVRGPYHAEWVFSFLEQRALDGIEEVEGLEYRRALFLDGERHGWLRVRWHGGGPTFGGGLKLSVPATGVVNLGDLLARVRRVFDLDADSLVVDEDLKSDPLLAAQLSEDPGLRVPGAWDGFEIAVRAILGQQVSVARAKVLATKLCVNYGGGDFPTAERLIDADVSEIGMPGKRGEAVRALAREVCQGGLVLDEGADPEDLDQALRALPGIGPWTAGYIGMRVARNPDAYVESDWVVLKMLDMTAARARAHAETWRPWRAYAVMVLWRMAAGQRKMAARRASAKEQRASAKQQRASAQ